MQSDLIWTKRDVRRFAAVYKRRVDHNPTKTRVIKHRFFEYILENWDRLQQKGTIRCLPNEAFEWIKNPTDDIFSHEYKK